MIIRNPIQAGNIGKEIEEIDILPDEAPLHVPTDWPSDAPAEPIAPDVPVPAGPRREHQPA